MRSTYAQGRHYVCLSSSDPIILQASNISRSSLLPTMQWSLPMEVPSLVLVLKSMWDRGMDGIWDRVFWLFMVDRLCNMSTSPCLFPQSLQIGWVTIGWVTVVNLARGRHGRRDHLTVDVQASWVCSYQNNVVECFNRTRWKLQVFIYCCILQTRHTIQTSYNCNSGYFLKENPYSKPLIDGWDRWERPSTFIQYGDRPRETSRRGQGRQLKMTTLLRERSKEDHFMILLVQLSFQLLKLKTCTRKRSSMCVYIWLKNRMKYFFQSTSCFRFTKTNVFVASKSVLCLGIFRR